MKYNLMMFSIILGLFSCKTAKDLPTVSDVNIEKYSGKWYEIAKLPNRFEKGMDCVSATYTIKENGKIKVENRGRVLKDTPRYKDITGTAWVPDAQFPGRLKVRFFWPFSGDYYIMELDDNYEYALVGSPTRNFLWVLSRTKTMDQEVYDQLMEIAQQQGFDTEAVESINQDCD
jgi:lipocalin